MNKQKLFIDTHQKVVREPEMIELAHTELPYKDASCTHQGVITIGRLEYCPTCDEFLDEQVLLFTETLNDKELLRIALGNDDLDAFLDYFMDGYRLSSLLTRRDVALSATRRMAEVVKINKEMRNKRFQQEELLLSSQSLREQLRFTRTKVK